MSDVESVDDRHPGLRWLVANETELADLNLQWVALTGDGILGADQDLIRLAQRLENDEAVIYHFVSFAVDLQTGRALLPSPR